MKFSERKGYKSVSNIIQIEAINETLRNSLWNVLTIKVWNSKYYMVSGIFDFSKMLWFEYFKKPIDTRPDENKDILSTIRTYFFECDWYEAYDFLEYIIKYENNSNLIEELNKVLVNELSGYRIIGGQIIDITHPQEIEMLNEALNDDKFDLVNIHLKRALELLADKKNPDYRNSIKESISAVENLCRLISSNEKSTLGDALKILEKNKSLHPALREGFSKLYGYTNDADGIRHSLMEVTELTSADAKYFLLSCTSFINYLENYI